MQGSKSLLRIDGLSVVTTDEATPILLDVDLSVDRGQVLCLVGESGCGKSVAMLSVLRLLPRGLQLTGGRVLFDETDLLELTEAEMTRRRGARIGWVPQDPVSSLDPTYTVGRHLFEILGRGGNRSRGELRREAEALIARVGLPEPRAMLDVYPHQLSGGMAQRAAIARALAGGPDLLIADEPTTALDVTTQRQILDLLVHLTKTDALALILVTHDLGVVAETADRVSVMYCGRVVETREVGPFFEGPRHPYAAELLRSVPDLESDTPVTPIRGSVPSMQHLPAGCAFHPRCPLAMDICRQKIPDLQPSGSGGEVACFADKQQAAA